MNTDLYDLFASKQYDLDRLHTFVDWIKEGDLFFPTGSGHTFAILMSMFGEVQIGDPGNAYLYIGDTTEDTETAKHNFRLILENEMQDVGGKVTSSITRLYVGDNDNLVQVFWFLPVNKDLSLFATTWTFDKIYLDVSNPTYEKFRPEIKAALTREKK